MNRSELPALYRAASDAATRFQNRFLLALRVHLISLTLAAALSVANWEHWISAFLILLVLGIALGCSTYLLWQKPEKDWYASRAVAESIKTIAWRFSVRVEPFQLEDERSVPLFVSRLRSVLEQNSETARQFHSRDSEEISASMLALRRSGLEERKATYLRDRVEPQRSWYATNASENKTNETRFLIGLIGLNLLALVLAALKIKFHDVGHWPTEIAVTAAACLLTWSQAKRFSELAASYSMAASEIRLVQAQALAVVTEQEFSAFVGDTENAFSREHTQWIARKDSAV